MLHYLWVYICFFFGIFIEGELVFLSAVIAASHGYLNIWLVIIVAIMATITSDLLYFNLGKNRAEKLMNKPKWKTKIESVNIKLEKHRRLFLVSYRFLYGLRIATPLVLGTQNITQITFIKYSIISTVIWVTLFTILGLSFGELILTYLKHIQNIEYYIIGGLLAIAIFFLIFRFVKSRTVI
ncbi:DedA family protein [Winogradskyella forsetii]|uniref:DedA family protein n=1 Tax=Winogradskyella forsetii TaxID=2686077 RepID=UPI0015BDE38E|nr:DedA family protein [Winogradskyella forsetii]